MPEVTPLPIDRTKVRSLYFALVGGLCAVFTTFASIFWLGTAPLLQTEGTLVLALAMSLVPLGPILLGWIWARPQVPFRPEGKSLEQFWQDPVTGGRALLVWALFEGSGIIGAVGTLLTGSVLTAGAALLGLASLLTNGPGYFESRRP
ncbi:MAG: hypothetical protein ABI742_10055 [Gemmatimonadota bacterium]